MSIASTRPRRTANDNPSSVPMAENAVITTMGANAPTIMKDIIANLSREHGRAIGRHWTICTRRWWMRIIMVGTVAAVAVAV